MVNAIRASIAYQDMGKFTFADADTDMDLINLPSVSNIFNQVATSSQPMFTEFLPLALFGLGFAIAAIIIVAIMGWIHGGVSNLIHPRDPYQ